MENANDLITMLESLIPEDLTISDLEGNKYKLPSKLSARKQIKALRMVEKGASLLTAIDAPEEAFNDVPSMISSLMGLFENDQVLDLIDETFEICYPGITKSLGDKPTECFEVEDIAKAFGPLALAFAKTLTKATQIPMS